MSQDFPVLFTLGISNKHDVILIDPTMSLSELSAKIQKISEKSPNCADALSKYAKKTTRSIKGIKVRWSGEPRDARLYPSNTIITEENVEAVLRLVSLHQGKDVFQVDAEEIAEEPEKGKEEPKKEGA